MTKQHNILGERPRRKNNKKVKASTFLDNDEYTKSLNKVLLNIGMCEKPKKSRGLGCSTENSFNLKDTFDRIVKARETRYIEKEPEMNFLQAFIILLLAIFSFFLLQRALDIHALNTCEAKGDCAEVIRDINGNR